MNKAKTEREPLWPPVGSVLVYKPQPGEKCPTCGYKVPQKSTERVRRHKARKKAAGGVVPDTSVDAHGHMMS